MSGSDAVLRFMSVVVFSSSLSLLPLWTGGGGNSVCVCVYPSPT